MSNTSVIFTARMATGVAGPVFAALVMLTTSSALAHDCLPPLEADDAIIGTHLEQADIALGLHTFQEIVDHGKALFIAPFNTCDGAGRPATTGGGDKRSIPVIADNGELLTDGQVAKLRTSAPDSDSCAGCHAQPAVGGAGDFVANVFVLAQTLDPVTFSTSAMHSNSRNTLGMNGSGPIEMLAREMTVDLQSQVQGLPDGWHTLITKGVEFDVKLLDGNVVDARGIDHDLVIKPFHQAGKVVSLREFSNNAMNHHHGIQAEERFDLNPDKGFDFDEDGYNRELTIGDITALSLWQAQLGVPSQVLPKSSVGKASVRHGATVFEDIGCAACHTPELTLNSRLFSEPNPFNPPGTCSDPIACPEYVYDMTSQGEGPLLEKRPEGKAVVRAYTDLKRHNLCDEPGPGAIRHFCNETLAQGRPDQDGKPGSEFFLTRKLWDVGNSAPYGHRGDLTTITEAILAHGGEGRVARDTFEASSLSDQRALVQFLKSLQVVPPGDHRGNGLWQQRLHSLAHSP
ncbi:hypothetical protein E2F43_18460 [Seongchinamella unica]|uniref:Di-haem oxidoreductase, peroxidase n=1 Tax=Seongchinamella unica TaxID=2547392 RepID=A0A4R5LMT5_9GAMM|nr:di-heme oxidoredictase family protein [Seongchinamella unica]TDG11370.1 hypothetical protein E2F43_18460 [Seongchinamella unica]